MSKNKNKNKKIKRKEIKSWILIAQILLAPLAMHRLLTFLLALINSHIYKTNKKKNPKTIEQLNVAYNQRKMWMHWTQNKN